MTETDTAPTGADEGRTSGWPAPVAPVPIRAVVYVPGSKSETNRALLLAALADGPTTIRGGLEARDTALMRAALRQLGATIEESDDGWRVTPADPVHAAEEIDCGLAGTVMRFVPALAALADGTTRFVGDEVVGGTPRPMRPLLDGLQQLGCRVEGDVLPFTVTGPSQPTGREVRIDSSASSQFVSALLLIGARLPEGLDLVHTGERLPSRPHIDMTVAMLRERGIEIDDSEPMRWRVQPGPIAAVDVQVAPDLSNAAPFLAAAAVTRGEVTIPGWPEQTDQPGDQLRHLLRQFGVEVDFGDEGLTVSGKGRLDGIEADLSGASELTPVVASIAALADSASRLTGIGHIRGHETDRLAALKTDIEGLGGRVSEHEDGITIHPRLLHSGDWYSFADHRMAQAGAVLGLVIDDIVVDDIACTAKTMPGFPDLWHEMIDAARTTSAEAE